MTANTDYLAKLRDPRWQKKRLEVLSRDEWTCQFCFDTSSTLNVHHCYYLHGREPWDYPLTAFVTLCESCHEQETQDAADAKHDLQLCFFRRFYANDIIEIAHAVDSCELLHLPQVIASAIVFTLSNESAQREMIERYFEFIKQQSTQKIGSQASEP